MAFAVEMITVDERFMELQSCNDSLVIVKRRTAWILFNGKCACSENDDRGCMPYAV